MSTDVSSASIPYPFDSITTRCMMGILGVLFVTIVHCCHIDFAQMYYSSVRRVLKALVLSCDQFIHQHRRTVAIFLSTHTILVWLNSWLSLYMTQHSILTHTNMPCLRGKIMIVFGEFCFRLTVCPRGLCIYAACTGCIRINS